MAQIATTRYQAPLVEWGGVSLPSSPPSSGRTRTPMELERLVFVATVLQTTPGFVAPRTFVRASRNEWTCGTKATSRPWSTTLRKSFRQPSSRPPDEEAQARSFNARVLSGRLRSAVRTLTDRSGGGVRQPDDLCSKAGRPVWQVLQEKHPALRDPTSVGDADGAFEPYPDLPAPVPVCIHRTTWRRSPHGSQAPPARRHRRRRPRQLASSLRTSPRRCEEMAAWTNWLANTSPPWAAYRAVMANRLVALDKQPGTRPVGIGEVYRRLWAKCLLKAIGSQATAACGNSTCCRRPPHAGARPPTAALPPSPRRHDAGRGLRGHRRRRGLSSAEASAVLLVDATNGFNELGRKAMLWTVRHRWANGARFSFNCYRHSAQLLLRRRGGDCEIILSREGVTQGDPLSMVLYGLALTPLAETIRERVPTVAQPWYADDAAMAGPVDGIAEAQRLLLDLGPRRGYFPEPDKSILIVPLATPPPALVPLAEFNFRHEEGHRYLGGFVGSGAAEAAWVDPQVQQWIEGVHSLAAAARRYPQTAYAGLSQSLQAEWQYLQRVTPDIAPAFAPLEAAIATVFLPALLATTVEEVAKLRPLLALPTRLGGLGIPDPTTTGEFCFAASKESTTLLQGSLVTGDRLCATEHKRDASRGRLAAKASRSRVHASRLDAILASSRPLEKRRIVRSAATGAWLSTLPSLLNGSDLSAEEFRDGVRLRFGLTPASLPPRCDGCGERFTTEHAMSCRKGGLILHRHNDLVATWGLLCGQAYTPSTVSDEPLIQPSQDVRAAGANRTEPPQSSAATSLSMGSGPEAPRRYSTSASPTPTPPRIATRPRRRSSCATRKRRRTSTARSALRDAVPSPLSCSRWTGCKAWRLPPLRGG
ncbi:hypothetical protein MHU86_8326 [Fragilaria crotonensis]|nr:hypothetical protein MHU86_8326 [Fragilaria crotonensis]